eukprot:jgi/Ulvmu1/10414/UM062_0010.1
MATVELGGDNADAAIGSSPHSSDFRQWCRRLGMVDEAATEWEKWHVKPLRTLVVCMGSAVGFCLVIAVTFTLGFPLDGWYPHVFVVSYVTVQTIHFGFFWRRGPLYSQSRVYSVCLPLILLSTFAVMIPAIAGPLTLVPFKNRLVATAAASAAVWLISLSGYTGASLGDQPETPHSSFSTALLAATWTTVRVMDPLTDMVLIRLMLELAEPPCYWFGRTAPCWRYHLLAILTGAFTSLYLLASVGLGVFGGLLQQPQYQKRLRWVFLAVHGTSFLCEAALVSVTLLKLFTEARDPRFGRSDPAAVRQLRINTAVTTVSFAFTAVAFVGTVRGLGAMLASLRSAVHRISARIVPCMQERAPMSVRTGLDACMHKADGAGNQVHAACAVRDCPAACSDIVAISAQPPAAH